MLQITSTTSDPDLGFTIISCFISPNSDPNVPSDYTLIETVCPKDDSVQYYPQRDFPVPHTETKKKSFSFTFNSKFNLSLLFLHCEMSLCSKRSHSNPSLPVVCVVIRSNLFLLFCVFYDFTVQAVNVVLVSPAVCNVSCSFKRRDVRAVVHVCNLADLRCSVLNLHPALGQNHESVYVSQISSWSWKKHPCYDFQCFLLLSVHLLHKVSTSFLFCWHFYLKQQLAAALGLCG